MEIRDKQNEKTREMFKMNVKKPQRHKDYMRNGNFTLKARFRMNRIRKIKFDL